MRFVSKWFMRTFLSTAVLLTATHAAQAVLIPDVTNPGDPILAIDTNSPSSFPGGEPPANAIDNSVAKYLNFGQAGSGFIVTPSNNPETHAVRSITFTTANDSEGRDPSQYLIFGTSRPILSTQNSNGNAEPWTFIGFGTVTLPADRNTGGTTVNFNNNQHYESFKVVFPAVKTAGENSMQIAEIELGANDIVTFAPYKLLIPIDRNGPSSSPNGEPAVNVMDGTVAKYLNFGEDDSGFIFTPTVNPIGETITSFTITTANDAVERDPASYEIWGTNNEIRSVEHSNGEAEFWTLISSGLLDLPDARNTVGPTVTFDPGIHFDSYKLIFPTVKNASANSMQIAEVTFGFAAAAIPEPASAMLGLLGVGALAFRRRRVA